jgi:hypothetical protein
MDDAPDPLDTSQLPDAQDHRAWVEWRTRMLRSGDPYWQPIADRLAERGLDLHSIFLVDPWQEDIAIEE